MSFYVHIKNLDLKWNESKKIKGWNYSLLFGGIDINGWSQPLSMKIKANKAIKYQPFISKGMVEFFVIKGILIVNKVTLHEGDYIRINECVDIYVESKEEFEAVCICHGEVLWAEEVYNALKNKLLGPEQALRLLDSVWIQHLIGNQNQEYFEFMKEELFDKKSEIGIKCLLLELIKHLPTKNYEINEYIKKLFTDTNSLMLKMAILSYFNYTVKEYEASFFDFGKKTNQVINDIFNTLFSEKEFDTNILYFILKRPYIDLMRERINISDLSKLKELIYSFNPLKRELGLALLQKIKDHPAIKTFLLSLWFESESYDQKMDVMFRILDYQDLSDEIHKDIYEFIQINWDRWITDCIKWHANNNASNILSAVKKRLEDKRFPISKAWIYLLMSTASPYKKETSQLIEKFVNKKIPNYERIIERINKP